MTKLIGEILVEKDVITKEQLEIALSEQKVRSKELLGTILVERGFVDKHDLFKVLAEQFSIPFLSIRNTKIDFELTKLIPSSLISEHKCFPLEKNEKSVIVAIANPLDVMVVSELEKAVLPYQLKIVLTTPEEVAEIVKQYRTVVRDTI